MDFDFFRSQTELYEVAKAVGLLVVSRPGVSLDLYHETLNVLTEDGSPSHILMYVLFECYRVWNCDLLTDLQAETSMHSVILANQITDRAW